jgi:hypothetical protein
MPALIPTNFYATITWLGLVHDRDAALQSGGVDAITALFSGPVGEAHGGLTRPSDSRVLSQYKRGTPIRNTRQFSIVSAEDMAAIAAKMGLPALDAALVGATMVVQGIPDFTHIPPSSRLQNEAGATLTVDLENRPCTLPARPIETQHQGFGAKFKAAAKGRRGVTAWVECEGVFRVGDRLRLHVPDQPVWGYWEAAKRGQDTAEPSLIE